MASQECNRIGVATFVTLWLGFMVVAQAVNAAVEIGCYPIEKASPKFSMSGGNYDPVTVKHEDCMFACILLSATYSGLQAGHCLCSDTAYLINPSADCGMQCPGDPLQSCGNDTHIAVPTDTLPVTPPAVQLEEFAGPIIAGQTVDLTTEGVVIGSGDIQLGIEPGDGSMTMWLDSTLVASHKFPTSGRFLTVVTARKNLLINAYDAVAVTVAMEAAGVCLQCPVAVEIGEPFVCTVEVILGSDVTLTMSVDDMDFLSMSLGGPTFSSLGVVGVNGSQTPATTSTWILPVTESLGRTRLLGIEALISEVGDGSFTLLILKPKCGTGAYCPTNNLCRSESECNYNPTWHSNPVAQDTCNNAAPHLYCLPKASCSVTSDSCSTRPVRFDSDAISPDRPSYEVVQLVPMQVTSPGLFYYNFSDTLCELFAMDVGYVLGLGFGVGGASISVETNPEQNTTAPPEYKSAINPTTLTVGGDLTVSNFQLDPAQHLMRATVVDPLVSQPQIILTAVGDFNVTATVTNSIIPAGVVDRVNVTGLIAISGLQYRHFKPIARPGQEVNIEISVLNGSHIYYTLDWGDGQQNETYTPDSASINQTHSYGSANTYEVNILASNLISNETLVVIIHVQNPVLKNHFQVTLPTTQAVEGDGTATLTELEITVSNALGEPLATKPQATVKCLDHVSCPPARTVDLSTLTSHNQKFFHSMNFTHSGTYKINVTIYNLVSEEFYEMEVTVYELLKGVTSLAMYKPSKSLSSSPRPGHGPLNDTFPLDRPVIFNMDYTAGSEVEYVVDFGDGSALENYTHKELENNPIDHKFPSLGTFTVNITASNPVTPGLEVRTTIHTLRPIRGIRIIDLGVSRANETRHLNVTIQDKGTNSCVVVDFGDGSAQEAYGHCGNHSNQHGELKELFSLQHVFRSQSMYIARASGWNTLSTDNTTISLPVSEARKYCGLPEVSIQNGNPGWWLPKVALRKERLAFQGVTKVNCWFTDNSKEWILEELDPQSGTLLKDQPKVKKLNEDTSTLLIESFFLDVGLYRLGYKVTMNKTLTENLEYSSIGYDYIDVQRSQLIVGLIEGQMTSVVKSFGSVLNLIPGKVSRDPDVEPGGEQGFEKIQYSCRRVGENYPSFDYYVEIPETRPENYTKEDDKGGCFGTGPGVLNSTLPALSWNASLMETNIRYELLVIIKKDIRRGNFSLVLELREGDPPQAAISIGRGTIYMQGDGAQVINPTGSVRLTASCNEFCSGVRYTWDIQALNGSDSRINLTNWKMWTSGDSEYLYIKREFFSAFPDYSLFEITAHAVNSERGRGYASMKIRLNEAPISGQCTVTPDSITAGMSVDIKCTDWQDWEGIAVYKFFAETAAFKAVLVNSPGTTSDVTVKPPLGSESNNYSVSLGVTAEDSIGATTTVIFANITVNPPVAGLSKNFSAEQEALYEILMSEGNPDVINAQLLLDASLLLTTTALPTASSDGPISEEDQRAEQTQAIDKMVTLQSSVKTTSSDDIILKSSTISIITNDTSTLSLGTLSTLSGIVDDMVSFVKSDTKTTSDESKVNNVGKGIVSFAGNILAGVSKSVTNPIDPEYKQSVLSQQQNQEESHLRAEAVLSEMEDSIQRLFTQVVDSKLPGEQPTLLSSPSLKLMISRQKASEIANQTISDNIGEVVMPGWCELMENDEDCNLNDAVDLKLQSTPINSYRFVEGSHPDRQDGGLVNITFFTNDTAEISVNGSSQDNLINISFSKLATSAEENFTTFEVTEGNSSFTHSFQVEGAGESVFIELRPDNDSMVYALFISFNNTVMLDEYDWMFVLPNKTDEETAESTTSSAIMLASTDFISNNISYNSTAGTPLSSNTSLLSTVDTSSTNHSPADNDYSTIDNNHTIPDNLIQTPSYSTRQDPNTETTVAGQDGLEQSTGSVPTGRWRLLEIRESPNPMAQNTPNPMTQNPTTNSMFSTTTDNLSTISNSSNIYQHMNMPNSSVENDTVASNNISDPDTMPTKPVSHTIMFGPKHHKGNLGKYFFRLAELAEDGTPKENFTLNYSLRILQAQCSFYQIKTNQWNTDGVQVILDEKTNLPICQTSHLTPFTTTWIVKPVPLDFDLAFTDFNPGDHVTIIITCCVVYTLFLFIFIWARRKDKKDVMMLGVTPLPDNNPSHSYLYEMVVVTGKRLNAGTESKVSFTLSGEDDETKSRCLEDPERKILQRGSVDRFLLTTAKPLGPLNYMRIWHDNSGSGSAQNWYLSYIAIRDLQTKRRYFFLCNEWFSVVDGDGQVDRLLPVAGKEQMQEFSHVFSSQTGKHFNDGHLWVSIFTRPPGSRFTRMQRAMCCLMALWLEMLASIMFYKGPSGGPSAKPFNIGPFSLSPSEIAIGIESNLIVFPISLLMVQCFKKSRVRRKRPSRIQVAKEHQKKSIQGGNKVCPMKTKDDICDTVSSRDIFIISNDAKINMQPSGGSSTLCLTHRKNPSAKRSQRWSLPWGCIYLAWIICILVTLTATAFTFSYGVYFENAKTTSWIHSVIISFFCGIILTQPVKVILVSLFIALVFKTPSADDDADLEEDEEDCYLQEDEEWLHTLYGTTNIHPVAARAPPDPDIIESQRIKRVKELKMYAIIREILFSIIFVWILSVFSYGNQDPLAFRTKDSYVKLLVRGDGNHTFLNATSIPKFWKWVNTGLIPGMSAGIWYNDQEPSPDEKNFLGDRYSKILGKVMFRQLRVPQGDCEVNYKMRGVIAQCNIGYSMAAQDEATYDTGWTPYNQSGSSHTEYTFTDGSELDSYPVWGRHALYHGGGYIHYVDTENINTIKAAMDKMYKEAWIDRYTRVLFIEFSVYNAQTNLFSFINLMLEILPTGGSYPNYRIDVLRLLTYHEGIGLVRVICEAIFFVFIICMTIKEIFLIRKEGRKYFKLFWNLNELAIIVFSIVTMVVYFFRLFVTNSLLDAFARRHNESRINLQYVAYWNELIRYMLGLLVFLSTLKFLKLLRFNRRMGLLSSTIRSCAEELLNFTVMFFFVFVAFASAFYLIFCNRLLNYSDVLFTMETMITAVLGKFRFGELLVTESVLGPLFFFGFTGYVCFVMINVFLTIIIGAFKTVKEDIENQSNEYEMVDFILSRFKSFTGIGGKKRKEDELLPNLDVEKYEEDIAKSLPNKVDQLLNRIAYVYFDQGTMNDFIKEVSSLEKKQEQSKSRKIFIS
ncbi:uncharacterized protein LOC110985237 [Acanthaster planci]|uniref:Uncharacterized protein LOC110985237 n=1 Tax=Acanthaster planci TaxID=133434 RepID=A0A8B7ZA09_ACAPL|nr:uncharacterized protein LOC110985237 [Acanthaster planci]